MEIMIPVWQASLAAQASSEIPTSLKECTIAVVDDNFDPPFTSRLEELLREAQGAIVERFIKPLGSAPSPKSLIEAAAKYRVAVVGIGM